MKKTTEVAIDVATPDDDVELLHFFQEFYPFAGWSEAVFRWQYHENPAGPIHHWVGRAKGRIVASFAVAPHSMRIFQKKKTGWRPQDLLIRPEYRGVGLYPALTQKLNSFLDNPDFPLNFTFPNPNSHGGFIKSGWKLAFPFPCWAIAQLLSVSSAKVKAMVSPVISFDESTNSIWEQYAKRFDLMIERSSDFLNWRYFANPKAKYSAFKLSQGSDRAVLVLKQYNREDGTHWAHICDLFYSAPSTELFDNALRYAICFARENHCDSLSCWYAAKPGSDTLFQRNQFVFQKELNRWVALYVHEDQIPENVYRSENRWHLTMGDSDVY